MNKKKTVFITQAAIIAAFYSGLTYFAAMLNVAYNGIQFRFSEALTILAALTPAAIPGLTIGCFLGNIGSPLGIADTIFGTLATLIAAVLSYFTRKIKFKKLPLLSALFPVITNAIIVGLEVAIITYEEFAFSVFLLSALQVGIGELVVCYGLGIPLYKAIKKLRLDKKL